MSWIPPLYPTERTVRLTRRERDILELLCSDLTNGEIARDLFLSVNTVKTMVARLLRALGVRSRTGAVAAVYSGRVRVLVDGETGAGNGRTGARMSRSVWENEAGRTALRQRRYPALGTTHSESAEGGRP